MSKSHGTRYSCQSIQVLIKDKQEIFTVHWQVTAPGFDNDRLKLPSGKIMAHNVYNKKYIEINCLLTLLYINMPCK